MYLGSVNRSATIAEVANRVMVSRNHLVKVVHNLGKLGFVTTERGKSGGIRLACSPELINVADVVRKMEPNFRIVECLNDQTNRCPLTPACQYKRIVEQAMESFMDVLGRHTVADLVRNRQDIATLLNVAN
jgi:Rrf2 family nitric oxide-sensitive transcriptional repressor